MSWSRTEVTLLIEEYRKWPNLYNIKSPNYKNRNLRTGALDKIKTNLKRLKPDVTSADIQTKFQALKQNAIKEYRKCENSKKSGTGQDEVYVPSLWYFDLIAFVFDYSVPREAYDSLACEDNEGQLQHAAETVIQDDTNTSDLGNDEETELLYSGVVTPDGIISPEPQASTSDCIPSRGSSLSSHRSPVPPKKRKKTEDTKLLETVSGSLKDISAKLTKTPSPTSQTYPKTTNESFGDYVVGKLNRINVEEIRDEVEEEIVSILNKGLKKCRQQQ